MCLWSRAINLKIGEDLTVTNFIRGFKLHVFDFGLPERCYTDSGSQIIPGANAIVKLIKDPDTQAYFLKQNVKALRFEQYSKGCNKLGSLVESRVKIVKKLIYASVRNFILQSKDFEFLIAQVKHLANRRPIAFKEG